MLKIAFFFIFFANEDIVFQKSPDNESYVLLDNDWRYQVSG